MKKFLTLITFILICLLVEIPLQAHAQAKVNVSSKTVVVNSKTYYLHTVKRKQTLYSIARAYKVSQDEIIKANPMANFSTLKTRSKIMIPMTELGDGKGKTIDKQKGNDKRINEKPLIAAKDRNDHSLGDVGDFIAVDSIFIAHENQINFLKGSTIKCALALPFNEATHRNWIEFSQGAMLAKVHLASSGVKLEIFNVAVNENAYGFMDMDTANLKKADIIIGPVHDKTYQKLARWANKAGIPIVAPFTQVQSSMSMPYSVQISPCNNSKYNKITPWLANANNNVILIHHNIYTDPEALAEITPYLPASTRRILYTREANAQEDILPLLNKDMNNIFIVPVSHLGTIEDILSKITSANSPVRKYDIEVLGTSKWRTANSVNPELFFRSNTRFVSSYYADRSTTKVADFYSDYITRYHKLPTLFAMRSYDIIMLMAQEMNKSGTNALRSLVDNNQPNQPLMTPYSFKLNEQGAAVNSDWPVVVYKEDYTVKCF